MCEGIFVSTVNLADCKLESREADPSLGVQAIGFISEFSREAKLSNEKYAEKQITVNQGYIESKEVSSLVLVGLPNKKGPTVKIKATFSDDLRKQLEDLKVGSRVTVKGEFSSFSDGTISLNRCGLVP